MTITGPKRKGGWPKGKPRKPRPEEPAPSPPGSAVIAPRADPFTLRADAPHLPATYTLADHAALQALAAGTATPDQQRRALDWIIHQASRHYDLSYRHGDSHATAFAEGRRFAGAQIVRVLNTHIKQQARSSAADKE